MGYSLPIFYFPFLMSFFSIQLVDEIFNVFNFDGGIWTTDLWLQRRPLNHLSQKLPKNVYDEKTRQICFSIIFDGTVSFRVFFIFFQIIPFQFFFKVGVLNQHFCDKSPNKKVRNFKLVFWLKSFRWQNHWYNILAQNKSGKVLPCTS